MNKSTSSTQELRHGKKEESNEKSSGPQLSWQQKERRWQEIEYRSQAENRKLIKDLRSSLEKAIKENDELVADIETLLRTCEKLTRQNASLQEENKIMQEAHSTVTVVIQSLLREVETKELKWHDELRQKERSWKSEKHEMKKQIKKLKKEMYECSCLDHEKIAPKSVNKGHRRHQEDTWKKKRDLLVQSHREKSNDDSNTCVQRDETPSIIGSAASTHCTRNEPCILPYTAAVSKSLSTSQSFTSVTVDSTPPQSPHIFKSACTYKRISHHPNQETNSDDDIFGVPFLSLDFTFFEDSEESANEPPKSPKKRSPDHSQCLSSNSIPFLQFGTSVGTSSIGVDSSIHLTKNTVNSDRTANGYKPPSRFTEIRDEKKYSDSKSKGSFRSQKQRNKQPISNLTTSLKDFLRKHNSNDLLCGRKEKEGFVELEPEDELFEAARDVLQITRRNSSAKAIRQQLDLAKALEALDFRF